ncbi:hypothetical protein RQP46_008856 [Phenoliferia psychrophenolica]
MNLTVPKLSWTVPRQRSTLAPEGVATNVDTDPTTPEQRTWGHGTMITFWCSDILSISGWQKCSAMISLGLDWRNAIGAVLMGCLCLIIPMLANGKIGSVNRIPFPVAIRSSHGYWLSVFPIASRAIIALFWFGIQTWNGQGCMTLMITAIWPSFAHYPNSMSASAGFTSKQMIAYFVFSAFQAPLLFVHPTKLQPLFIFKSTRSIYLQAPLIPFIYLLLALCSVITASCTKVIAGKVLWSPVDVIALWDSRAAVFFAALVWAVAQMSTNISTNSISAANDLSTLFPRFVNIRRGQIIVSVVGGWCMVPWKILASATTFYNFISGYAIVLGPFAGLMASDYYFIKHQRLDVPALYDPHGRYRFYGGCNWRAIVALVVGISPNMYTVFLIKDVAKVHIGGASWIYAVSWLYGIVSASIVYTALSLLFPDKTGSLIDVAVHADDFLAEKESRANNSGTASVDYESEKGEKQSPVVGVLPVV